MIAGLLPDYLAGIWRKKTPAKCGRFLLFGFGYGFKYSVTLTSATIASNVNAFINSRIY